VESINQHISTFEGKGLSQLILRNVEFLAIVRNVPKSQHCCNAARQALREASNEKLSIDNLNVTFIPELNVGRQSQLMMKLASRP
jgi:NifU-like protein involved in Fe-S cluster formation